MERSGKFASVSLLASVFFLFCFRINSFFSRQQFAVFVRSCSHRLQKQMMKIVVLYCVNHQSCRTQSQKNSQLFCCYSFQKYFFIRQKFQNNWLQTERRPWATESFNFISKWKRFVRFSSHSNMKWKIKLNDLRRMRISNRKSRSTS